MTITIIGGVALLAIFAVAQTLPRLRAARAGATTEARCFRVTQGRNARGDKARVWHQFEFTTTTGARAEFGITRNRQVYGEGSRVQVMYDPKNPSKTASLAASRSEIRSDVLRMVLVLGGFLAFALMLHNYG
ncbi:DUF3592 domain-containing protein [Streptomyces sp. A7024]|uniref:DUF3592 domain-containing protein n=1 Tax=Streptomyces coryli TaxID=1128680 RepID=A0A6G4U4F4_9ACTN|nr:DUF3592 domain-containing protein [Streptomyces coryli]NGN67054.1 DUF3592 domain-containing protein [Streptomyces coryli]